MEKLTEWREWQNSLKGLSDMTIPRTYASFPLTSAKTKELYVFSDTSVKAIAAVAYLKIESEEGELL